MEINEPKINIEPNLNDNSKTDESFSQANTTVNIGNGGTYNQNSGNKKQNQAHPLIVIFICCVNMFFITWYIKNSLDKNSKIEQLELNNIETQLMQHISEATKQSEIFEKGLEESKKQSKSLENSLEIAKTQSKEGSIWILRHDILKSIQHFEELGHISQSEYKQIKDEFEYYKSIGGNHDVQEKFDMFFTKIFGLNQIKMTN